MLLPFFQSEYIEAGCDEAGRGCLAGPVFAAAVILPKDYSNKTLNDSKQIAEQTRYALGEIIEKDAIAFAVAQIGAEEIDHINILNASIKAMHLSLDQLKKKFQFIIVDGNKFKPYKNIPHQTIVKGDGKYLSIAAASILAKTYRDDFMTAGHNNYPQNDWFDSASDWVKTKEVLKNIELVFIVACGTSNYAGMIGKYLIEQLAKVPVEIDIASEFRYRNPVIPPKTLLITISQSGETADTLAAIRMAKELGATTLSICNVRSSTIDREAHGHLYMNSGPEIGVASTKAFTSTMAVLNCFAIAMARVRGVMDSATEKDLVQALLAVPSQMEGVLAYDKYFGEAAAKLKLLSTSTPHFLGSARWQTGWHPDQISPSPSRRG